MSYSDAVCKVISTGHQEKRLSIPPSKSHSIRAILFATMATGRSFLKGLLESPDIEAALSAAKALGAGVHRENSTDVTIDGVAGVPKLTTDEIDVGNSGQVLRFFGALAALSSQPILFKGDASISSQRTIEPLLHALNQLGARAESLNQNGFAPMRVQGPMRSGRVDLCGRDSQPVSGMLIATAFLGGPTTIQTQNAGELPWIALTLSWLDRLGIGYRAEGPGHYQVKGGAQYRGFSYQPPGDFSSAAFPAIAALITGQEVTLDNLDSKDVQGDRQLFDYLHAMGALIEEDFTHNKVHIKPGLALQGISIDVNPLIDALPILAVLGCFAKGETHLTNALPARGKECDRIHVMAQSLKRLGADIEEESDGLKIRSSTLKAPLDGKPFSSYGDHRIAMALTVAALFTQGELVIEGVGCIEKSYRTFVQDMRLLGACIQEESKDAIRVKGVR